MHYANLLAAGLLAASAVIASPAMPSKPKHKRTSSAPNSVVMYWGQGDNIEQIALDDVCNNPSIDIVVLAFVNVFPDQGAGGYPGTNFASACGSGVYQNNNVDTQLLNYCPQIGPGITTCQANGKKVLLSIGGAAPGNYYLASKTSAENFADFLWGAFGPYQGDTSTYPRPFDYDTTHPSVDGFDLDIESPLSLVTSDQQSQFYPDLVARLRYNYGIYTATNEGAYYVSAAPQCVVPDAHFPSTTLAAASFDYIFVQLYNTDSCSARAYLDGTATDTFTTWLTRSYANSNTQVFAGLPANVLAANGETSGSKYYLTPSEVKTFVNAFVNSPRFAGIMLWEASFSAKNLICGNDYAYWVKKAVADCFGGSLGAYPSTCASSTSSSSIASSTSSTISSSSSSYVITSSSTISSYSSSTSSYSVSSSSSYSVPTSSSSWSSSSSSRPATTSSYSFSRGPYLNSSSSTFSYSEGGNHPQGPTSSYGGGFPGPVATSSKGGFPGPKPSNSEGGEGGVWPPAATSSGSAGEGGVWPPAAASSGSAGEGGVWPPAVTSSGSAGGHGGHGHPKPTYTKTLTSSYVDVCDEGITTEVITWTTTWCPEDDATASSTTWGVPEGWTTTVTVCTHCGPKPTTLTLTKPWGIPTSVAAQATATETSMQVVWVSPVPESVYWSAVGGKPAPTTPVAPVAVASTPVKPVVASPAATAAKSWASAVAAPLGTGSASTSGKASPQQFTGAASKMTVGASLFIGLVVAMLAM